MFCFFRFELKIIAITNRDSRDTFGLIMPLGKQLNVDKSDNEFRDSHPEQPIELGPHGRGVGRWVPDEKHLYLGVSEFLCKRGLGFTAEGLAPRTGW